MWSKTNLIFNKKDPKNLIIHQILKINFFVTNWKFIWDPFKGLIAYFFCLTPSVTLLVRMYMIKKIISITTTKNLISERDIFCKQFFSGGEIKLELTFITDDDVILWWLFLLLLLLLLFCSFKFGDCGLDAGGEMITFLPISMSTAAVSRCCCNWLRFFTLICGGASDGEVREDDCCCCCCCLMTVSNGITETELASKFCKWILLIREVTDDFDTLTGGDDVSLFLLLLLLLIQLLTGWWWWKFMWWLLLRNAVNAAIAVSSSDSFSCDGAKMSSNFADDCRIISCNWTNGKVNHWPFGVFKN